MALATTVCAQNTAQDFVNLHNKARAAVGVGPVVWDPVVARYARNYAAWLGTAGLYSPRGPTAKTSSGAPRAGRGLRRTP
ncbi:hypothetical protein PR202_gb17137 [Eleusine coracana subsp. coracana]|uniref:SCP domain-containing protein n=1 Tax=Eleusine coracana subsp. coracana TaxID=191504 RepID=A0AAV5F2S3_ELECO|nr:hypothetical protein PR202_gb17137 [Eleusine coracana subsp. coracana]